jgi:hypothetical protein
VNETRKIIEDLENMWYKDIAGIVYTIRISA